MLGTLIAKVFTGEAGIFIARMKVVALLYALIGVFVFAMLLFLLAALFIWIASIYGGLATSLGFALGCLVIVAALYVTLVIARRPPKERASDRLQRDIASIASVAAFSNMPAIARSVRRRKSLLVVPVALAGIWGAVRVVTNFRRS